MSTTMQQNEIESKQQDTYSGKDDQKQQASLSKKQTKQSDVPVDSGSSLVGGTLAAMQNVVDRSINMLPASLQDRAHSLEEQAKLALGKASEIAAPVVESLQQDGIIAAAKTAGGIGTQAASSAASSLKASVPIGKKDEKADLKGDKKELKGNIKADKKGGKMADLQKSAASTASNLQASAIQLKDQAIGAAMNLKDRVMPAGDAAAAPAPKKHGRRRRGGRGHGNRKMKTKLIEKKEDESITDTLGDKAKQLKQVVIEDTRSSSGSGGIVDNIRSTVTGITSNITSTASGVVGGVQARASGLVSGAQAKAAQLSGTAKSLVSDSAKSNKLERKPSLQRRDELPSLGTPTTPDVVTHTADGKLAAKPADQSSLLDKAKFAVGGVVEATRDFVADKLDNLSMNADDTTPLDKSDRAALKQANKQLDSMKKATKQ